MLDQALLRRARGRGAFEWDRLGIRQGNVDLLEAEAGRTRLQRDAGDLVIPAVRVPRNAVVPCTTHRVRERRFVPGQVHDGLARLVGRVETRVRRPAAVRGCGGTGDLTVVVHLQRPGLAHARIRRIAFVVVREGFAGVHEVDPVTLRPAALQHAHREVLLDHRIRVRLPRAAVAGVDLLPEQAAAQGTTRLSLFLEVQAIGQYRVLE